MELCPAIVSGIVSGSKIGGAGEGAGGGGLLRIRHWKHRFEAKGLAQLVCARPLMREVPKVRNASFDFFPFCVALSSFKYPQHGVLMEKEREREREEGGVK